MCINIYTSAAAASISPNYTFIQFCVSIWVSPSLPHYANISLVFLSATAAVAAADLSAECFWRIPQRFSFFSMQRSKPPIHVFVYVASGWQCVWSQYFQKSLAPISHVLVSHPMHHPHAPNFGHTVAVLSLFLIVQCLLWFLFVFNDHDSSNIMCFSFIALVYEKLCSSTDTERAKVLTFSFPPCREASVECRKSGVRECVFKLQQDFHSSVIQWCREPACGEGCQT